MSVNVEILTITHCVVLSHRELRDIVLITRWHNKTTSCSTWLLGYWKSEIETKTLTHESGEKGPQTKQSRRQLAPLFSKAIECFLFDFLGGAVIQNDNFALQYMAVGNDRTAAKHTYYGDDDPW